ncbi:hypothetical protein R1flu_011431 [Riccia fluitans]|uniref:Reverse transcriptase/retrotransposon-derived protein RNase H-like domain-containing protein n=1 Tax=Riccia fluitans TaxID=41844 RepID=A0ABD1Z7T0_9MARC
MNKVLRDFIPKKTMPFLDDIPIKGCREEDKDDKMDQRGCKCYVAEHIEDCEKILSRLEKAHLTLYGAKSIFGVWEVVIVGHLCDSFDQRLYALCRKGQRFRWKDEHIQAMKKLKALLSSSPILGRVDYKCRRPVILTVDTSPLLLVGQSGKMMPKGIGLLHDLVLGF